MTDHDTLAVLRRAILLDPDDDLPRHAYADALEEAGDDARVAAVRWMLANQGERVTVMTCDVSGLPFHKPLYLWSGGVNGVCDALRRDLPDLPFRECVFRRGFLERVSCTAAAWERHGPDVARRHPVTQATLTDRQPMVVPPHIGNWYWRQRNVETPRPHHLPAGVFALLSPAARHRYTAWAEYPSPEDALADLGRAAADWARREAGLPPLEERR